MTLQRSLSLSAAAADEHLDDVLGEVFPDLAMSRHRLDDTGSRVPIPVVLTAVSLQHTAGCFQLLDQIDALHETTRSSTLRIPGTCPLLIS